MQINLTETGHLPNNCPAVFYRLEHWMTGKRIADYTTHAEAVAASYASAHGGRYDHKVSTVHLSR